MTTTINQYDVGDAVRCTSTFADTNGTATDPDNLFFQWRTPDGTLTTKEYGVDAEVLKVSTGVYACDLNIDADGTWQYRFYGVADDGDFQGSDKHQFRAVGF